MISRTTTHQTTMWTPQMFGSEQPQTQGAFVMDGLEQTMDFDGKIEDKISQRVFFSEGPTDIERLTSLFNNPSVTAAEEQLAAGSETVKVELGDLGTWTASSHREGVRFTHKDDIFEEITLGKRDNNAYLMVRLPGFRDETVEQSVMGRYNPETGTITATMERIVTTIKS